MSVISVHGSDDNSEAQALVRFMLVHGDIVGTDHAGHTVLQIAVDPWLLDQLCAFDAGSEDLEYADAEPKPDQETDAASTALDVVRAKRAWRASRCLRASPLALLLVTVPHVDAAAPGKRHARTGTAGQAVALMLAGIAGFITGLLVASLVYAFCSGLSHL